jgi:hypothetical protein
MAKRDMCALAAWPTLFPPSCFAEDKRMVLISKLCSRAQECRVPANAVRLAFVVQLVTTA